MVSERIIIYRKGAIGDIIHTLPLVKLIRQYKPGARIDYIVGTKHIQELLSSAAGYIDGVWADAHKFSDELKASLQEHPATEFIYLHSGWHKAWLYKLRFFSKAKMSIYKRDDSLSAVLNYVTSVFPEQKLALQDSPFEKLEYKTLDADKCNTGSPQYIAIVPGVGALRPHRAYPLNKWLEFIRNTLDKTKLEIKILGGPDEIDLAKQIDGELQDPRIENLIGKTSLLEVAQILTGAERLYSADTGILHIGAAVGVPITSIFSITSEARFGPFHPEAEVLRSSDCKCMLSTTNVPKHCSNLDGAFAGCMKSVELVQRDTMVGR